MSVLSRLGTCAAFILAALAVIPGAAQSQPSPADYTMGLRHDLMGRPTGTIFPDPDGAGPLHYRAERRTYDDGGRLVRVENGELATWQSEAVDPANWDSYAVFDRVDTVYDSRDHKVQETMSSGGVAYQVTQASYDPLDRLVCTAVRLNQAAFGNLPDACTLGPASSNGPDRITKNVYDADGQLLQVREAVGTSDEAALATYDYTPNGHKRYVIDANGNRAELVYDVYDRQSRWVFPAAARPSAFNDSTPATALATAGAVNAGDYEEYLYDPNGNRTSLRKRDGSTLGFSYDGLDRMTVKVVPERIGLTAAQTRDVYFEYDLRGLQTKARFDSLAGEGITNEYDGFGRLTTSAIAMGGATRTLSYSQYDRNGSRLELTYPDSVKMSFAYDGLNRMTGIFEGALGSTVSLGSIVYDNGGRRFSLTRRYGDKTDYNYDGISRLASLTETFVGSTGNTDSTFGYNPASQVILSTRSNDAYAWREHTNVVRPYTTNGLNQYTVSGPLDVQYDPNGNLIQASGAPPYGTRTYLYDIENRLVQAGAAASASLVYDPLGRLFQTSGGSAGPTQFLYDGDELVAEYDGITGMLLRRYVHGAGVDDPLVWYDGAGLTQPRYLHTDHQGSITGIAGATGALLAINAYDEYGIPAATNLGRFAYTGQAWIPELGMYYYKARIYSPSLGRFMQTDPIGYKDQINLYAYVGNDPVNKTDPTGMEDCVRNGNGTQTCRSSGSILSNIALVLRAGYETVAYYTGLPSMTPSAPKGATTASNNPQNDTRNSAAAAAAAAAARNQPRIYHRLEGRTQTPRDAARQERTGVIGGYAAFGSDIPTVKAYDGPLPAGRRGIEFSTTVPPARGSVPGQPKWYPGQPGVGVIPGEKGPMAVIPAIILKNTQRESP